MTDLPERVAERLAALPVRAFVRRQRLFVGAMVGYTIGLLVGAVLA